MYDDNSLIGRQLKLPTQNIPLTFAHSEQTENYFSLNHSRETFTLQSSTKLDVSSDPQNNIEHRSQYDI